MEWSIRLSAVTVLTLRLKMGRKGPGTERKDRRYERQGTAWGGRSKKLVSLVKQVCVGA